MTHRLVFVTLGVMKEPRGRPAMRGFLERIGAEHGPTPRAFNLRKAFDADGHPAKSQRGDSPQRPPAR